MQKDHINPLPSADITNPSIFRKIESLSSIPRSLNESLSQLSFSSTGSLARSVHLSNPNESRTVVKNYIAPTNATKRHGSDIKVIYHADQLADKWENILPLTLGPLEKNEKVSCDSSNPQAIIAESTGQTYELIKSPLAFDSNLPETPIKDQNHLDDFINKSAADLVENLFVDINQEVAKQNENAIRKSTELLVEYILIESLSQESENYIEAARDALNHEMFESDTHQTPANIREDSKESPNMEQDNSTQTLETTDNDLHTLDCNQSHTYTESDSDESEFDLEEMEKLEQEQLSKKIIERTLKMIHMADKKDDDDLEEGKTYRNMVSGSWMVGLNVPHNYSELRDSVIFRDKKYSIKLNDDSISCGDLFHKKYAFYFPIMLCDVLSAIYSDGGLLHIFFLQKRLEKGPKLRCIQLRFLSDSQAELWASTILKRAWKGKLKSIAEKQALILVDKASLDLVKLVKKYVCSIFQCAGKIFALKEIEMADCTTCVASVLGSEPKRYDTIALFSHQSSNIKDSLQKLVKGYVKNTQYLEMGIQDNQVIDAVQCASLLLTSKKEESDMCMLCCSIKRDKGFIQKMISQFSVKDSKSIVDIAK